MGRPGPVCAGSDRLRRLPVYGQRTGAPRIPPPRTAPAQARIRPVALVLSWPPCTLRDAAPHPAAQERFMRPIFGTLASSALLVAAPHIFAQALTPDPTLVTGELDNGLHYIARQHAVPPGHATVWCHIHSGSLNETEHQRGIAHYLEHMAFNGSENFAPGTLVPFFQSLGMTFGRDQNAFTNMQETTYQLT